MESIKAGLAPEPVKINFDGMNYLITFILFICLLNCLVYGVKAQDYDLNSLPPYDPQVRTGILANGMKYFIRTNKLPDNRAEFYLVNNAGAIQEEDDQNGLAHFTEHMAFNGTKNFPKKSLIEYLGTIGVKFGRNLNAGTGVEQTIFRITSVPLLRESIIDSVLLIFHDWSNFLTFDSVEIDSERGVIREEWRTYGSAGERMNHRLLPVIYKDSKYAKRNVIGDTAVINHFKYETLRNFYHQWFRPENQALVIIGDFDLNVMEAKVKKLFGDIQATFHPVPKKDYDIPDNTEPLIGLATDPETSGTDVSVYFKAEPVPDSAKNLGYMRLRIVQRMINIMFVQRIAEITRKENPPFTYAYCRYGSFTRVKDAFSGYAQARKNESIRALTALLTEMERLKRFGFTQGELDRVKADLNRSYESQYAERDKRKSSELVNPNISYFTVNNPNPGIDFEYAFAKAMIPQISLKEINDEVQKYVHDENMIVTITAPEKEGYILPREQEIKDAISQVKQTKIEPYVDNTSGKKLIAKEPKPGKIIKTIINRAMGTTEWTLSNGVKVILKPTDFKADEILMDAWSMGGYSAAADSIMVSARLTDNVAVEMGAGEFSRTDLVKMLAGKKVNITPSISYEQESLGGYMSPRDFETAMQMIYMYFTQPRWNEKEYFTWLDKMRNNFDNIKSDPHKAFSDSINTTLSRHNIRYRPDSYEMFDEASFGQIKAFYHDRYCDASDFTFLFTGKINPDSIKPFVQKYLATLPTVKRKDVYMDDGVRLPKGKVTNDFSHENRTPRASVFINYNGESTYTAMDMLYLATIRHILELRYTETIREEKGGSYHVRVTSQLAKRPETEFSLNMIFDTDPKMADSLKAIVYREVNKLVKEGPSEADLNKAREYFLKQRQEDLSENNWWLSTVFEYYYDGVDILNGYDENVKNLTSKAIKDYASKTLTQGNVIEVIMRPAEKESSL